MRSWLENARLPENPGCAVRFEQLEVNPPHATLGVTLDRYLGSLDAFRASRFAELEPAADVLAWLGAHGTRFRHVAVTATPLAAAAGSSAWVMRHFGRWIPVFAVAPSPR